MESKSTDILFNELLFNDDIDNFIFENDSELKSLTLESYLNYLLKEKKIKKKDVINSSKINLTYGYQIFSGQRKPSRNKLLQLIFGLGVGVLEAQKILKLAGVNELYVKNKRDSIILFCLKKGLDIFTADDMLYKYNQEVIINEEE